MAMRLYHIDRNNNRTTDFAGNRGLYMPLPKQHSQIGPSQAHPGPIRGPTLPNWGPTGAHVECCLGRPTIPFFFFMKKSVVAYVSNLREPQAQVAIETAPRDAFYVRQRTLSVDFRAYIVFLYAETVSAWTSAVAGRIEPQPQQQRVILPEMLLSLGNTRSQLPDFYHTIGLPSCQY